MTVDHVATMCHISIDQEAMGSGRNQGKAIANKAYPPATHFL